MLQNGNALDFNSHCEMKDTQLSSDFSKNWKKRNICISKTQNQLFSGDCLSNHLCPALLKLITLRKLYLNRELPLPVVHANQSPLSEFCHQSGGHAEFLKIFNDSQSPLLVCRFKQSFIDAGTFQYEVFKQTK